MQIYVHTDSYYNSIENSEILLGDTGDWQMRKFLCRNYGYKRSTGMSLSRRPSNYLAKVHEGVT